MSATVIARPLLSAHSLSAVRGGRTLFEDIDIALDPDSALLVKGPNGAGKTTLLRMLAGLSRPTAGTVERRGRIAYLGHRNALKPDHTLRQELVYWGAAKDAHEDFGLDELMDVPLRLLSEGLRRRAALVRLARSRAALWLLDEPGAGLDTDSRAQLSRLIAAHLRAGGAAVIATHGETTAAGANVLAL